MNCTPAEVVAAFLVSEGLASRPASAAAWPVTIASMPDDTPDERIAVYDLSPELQGKLHETGETVERPKVQIRTRAKTYRNGMVKLKAALVALSAAFAEDLTVNGVEVTLITATVEQAAGHVGQEEKNTRQLFTAVVKLAIKET